MFRINSSCRAAALLAAALITTLAKPVCAGGPTEQYLSLRRSYPPAAGFTLEAAKSDPQQAWGKTVEVEGRLLGIARSSDGASLMLATDKSGVLALAMSQVPSWVQPGDRLRALVVMTQGDGTGAAQNAGVMVVVAVASASDIAAMEVRWRSEAAARGARERQQVIALGRAVSELGRRPISAKPGRARVPAARPWLDARSASLSRSLSPNARAVYAPYRNAIRTYNKRLSEREVEAITTSILLFSERMDVDPRLVIALVLAESSFKPGATSRVGAMGLGQIMPGTAREIGLTNPYDPVQNIEGAVYLLKTRLDKYSGGAPQQSLTMQQIILALASYNAGMGAVKKYGGVPPYRETRNYVKKVEKIYRSLCPERGGS